MIALHTDVTLHHHPFPNKRAAELYAFLDFPGPMDTVVSSGTGT
jgi:hypothetical protein